MQTQKLWFEDLDTDKNRALPWTLQRDSAALLLVDLENELLEEGAIMEVPDGRRIIPTVKRLLEACRGLGVPVIYTRMVHQSARVAPRLSDIALRTTGVSPWVKALQPEAGRCVRIMAHDILWPWTSG